MLGWIFGTALLSAALVVAGFAVLILNMPGRSFEGVLPTLNPHECEIAAELRRHVHKLGGEIGERNVFRPEAYAAAARYIADEFAAAGYAVERHPYQVEGVDCENLVVQAGPARVGGEVLIAGAHYDSIRGCPAANDNGTGVATMLVLARQLARRPLERAVRFAAFANEEVPFFTTDAMGSLRYARACRARGDNIIGMISLESCGYYSDDPDSQTYPAPFGWYAPRTANFIEFTSNLASRAFLREMVGAFRRNGQFPSRAAALPAFVKEATWSDHWAFWQCGYPAIIVTDTAPFRYAQYYHSPHDTPDRLDYERMARVVVGLEHALVDLAGECRG